MLKLDPRPTRPSVDLARAISTSGTEEFADSVLDYLQTIAKFDEGLIVLYAQKHRPVVLCDWLHRDERENSTEQYVSGAYLLDPFFIASRRLEQPMAVTLKTLVPREFRKTPYFLNYYRKSDVCDELNYLLPIGEGRTVAIAIERAASGHEFNRHEIGRLRGAMPVVSALLGQHIKLGGLPTLASAPDEEHERLTEMLDGFAGDVLTPREAEISRLLLDGHSAKSIAEHLTVSVETIRAHRRNIYDKLRISSVAELFALALKAILGAKLS